RPAPPTATAACRNREDKGGCGGKRPFPPLPAGPRPAVPCRTLPERSDRHFDRRDPRRPPGRWPGRRETCPRQRVLSTPTETICGREALQGVPRARGKSGPSTDSEDRMGPLRGASSSRDQRQGELDSTAVIRKGPTLDGPVGRESLPYPTPEP